MWGIVTLSDTLERILCTSDLSCHLRELEVGYLMQRAIRRVPDLVYDPSVALVYGLSMALVYSLSAK